MWGITSWSILASLALMKTTLSTTRIYLDNQLSPGSSYCVNVVVGSRLYNICGDREEPFQFDREDDGTYQIIVQSGFDPSRYREPFIDPLYEQRYSWRDEHEFIWIGKDGCLNYPVRRTNFCLYCNYFPRTPCVLEPYTSKNKVILEPNPYYWHNGLGYWPFPWDNWPTKTPWDRQRGRGGNTQSNTEGLDDTQTDNNVIINQVSLVPSPSSDYGDLPYNPSAADEASSSPFTLPDMTSSTEANPILTDTTTDNWDYDLLEEPLWKTPDGNSFPVADTTGIWEFQEEGDPIASTDDNQSQPLAAIAEPEPLLFSIGSDDPDTASGSGSAFS